MMTPETARALVTSARDFYAADAELRKTPPGAEDALHQARAMAYVGTRRVHATTIDKAELEIRQATIEAST